MAKTESSVQVLTKRRTQLLLPIIALLWFSHIYLLGVVPEGFILGVPLWFVTSYVTGLVTIGLIYLYLFNRGGAE